MAGGSDRISTLLSILVVILCIAIPVVWIVTASSAVLNALVGVTIVCAVASLVLRSPWFRRGG